MRTMPELAALALLAFLSNMSCSEPGLLADQEGLVGVAEPSDAPESTEFKLEVLEVHAEPERYAVIRLRNIAGPEVYYNLCGPLLVAADGSVQTSLPAQTFCPAYAWTMRPGQHATYGAELRGDIPRGEYRFMVRVRDEARREFRVTSEAVVLQTD